MTMVTFVEDDQKESYSISTSAIQRVDWRNRAEEHPFVIIHFTDGSILKVFGRNNIEMLRNAMHASSVDSSFPLSDSQRLTLHVGVTEMYFGSFQHLADYLRGKLFDFSSDKPIEMYLCGRMHLPSGMFVDITPDNLKKLYGNK